MPSTRGHAGLLAERFGARMSLPLIAAPMFRVSGPELVIAACRAGVIGAFPSANCRSLEDFDAWLGRIAGALGPGDAPWCPNLIMRRESLRDELALLLRHRPEVEITSVGPPDPVVAPLHDIGCLVLCDVASVRHAEKAVAAGVDGLILLTAGAGGQTGWANGFAFVRAVREFFDGPVVLAGGVADGAAVLAAQVLGCDAAYMGTKFIATWSTAASTTSCCRRPSPAWKPTRCGPRSWRQASIRRICRPTSRPNARANSTAAAAAPACAAGPMSGARATRYRGCMRCAPWPNWSRVRTRSTCGQPGLPRRCSPGRRRLSEGRCRAQPRQGRPRYLRTVPAVSPQCPLWPRRRQWPKPTTPPTTAR